jgi:hypothetical protein
VNFYPIGKGEHHSSDQYIYVESSSRETKLN